MLMRVLNSNRGWGRIAQFHLVNNANKFYFGSNPGRGTIVIMGKYTNAQIQHAYPNTPHINNMSFTIRNVWPPVIVFNKNNWNGPPNKYLISARKKYPNKSRDDLLLRYRAYLINHEFGHALGIGHERATLQNCPLMYQHTRGVGFCKNDSTWPTKQNLDTAARHIKRFLVR